MKVEFHQFKKMIVQELFSLCKRKHSNRLLYFIERAIYLISLPSSLLAEEAVTNSAPTLPLSGIYSKIEQPPIAYQGKTIHLYPTEKIKELYTAYKKTRVVSPDLDFAAYLTTSGAWQHISLSQEATIYIPLELRQPLQIHIAHNRLYQGRDPLPPGDYIFAIDQMDRCFAAKKTREGPEGRIQHSSLSEGLPVKAAGWLILEEEGRMLIDNRSGHYKPAPETLDYVIEWLKRRGLEFTLAADTFVSSKTHKNVRRVVLEQTNQH